MGNPLLFVFTLVEDVHTRLVSIDDFQDFGVSGEDPDDVPVIFQQFLCRLQLRDAPRHHQSVPNFRFGGPVKGGVINLCKGERYVVRVTCPEGSEATAASGQR